MFHLFAKTFEKVSYEWLEEYKHTVKESTFTSATYRVEKVNFYLGQYKINRLTSEIINNYLEHLANEQHLKRKTLTAYKQLFGAIINFSKDKRYIKNTLILNDIRIPKQAKKSTRFVGKFLERHEIRRIINNMVSDEQLVYARIATLLAYTGMRYGELAALDYTSDINLTRNELTISKTYNFVNKILTTTKTGAVTTIKLHDEAITAIKEQIAYTTALKKVFRLENTFLFMTKLGTPVSIHEFNKALKKYGPEDKRVTSHYFRHSLVTMLIEEGLPFHSIARQVGHKNSEMVSKVYGHFSAKMNKELTDTVTGLKIE